MISCMRVGEDKVFGNLRWFLQAEGVVIKDQALQVKFLSDILVVPMVRITSDGKVGGSERGNTRGSKAHCAK